MANEQNLTMAGKTITSSEIAKRWGRIGGSRSTPAKKLAAKLRELKKKGLTSDSARRLFELMTQMDLTDLDILINLESLRKENETTSERRERIRLYMEWRKLRHGDKLNLPIFNQMNVDVSMLATPDEIINVVKQNEDDDNQGNDSEMVGE